MDTQNRSKAGSLLGGILLVSGCSIGAGMLGLPVLTAIAGFTPSFAMFIISWLFMLTTGLLLLEVNLWFKREVSIITMAGETLGNIGKAVGWVVFLFLFYSLMVAYFAGSGELFTDLIKEASGVNFQDWLGSLVTLVVFGSMIYLGTGAVDRFNRLLMLGLVASYVLLIILGIPHVNLDLLKHQNWGASLFVIPVMIISFGFHNLVPSLTHYMQGDVKRLRLTLIIGSAIPLAIYLVWEYVILGIIPLEGKNGFLEALDNGEIATRALKYAVGASWIVDVAQYFAFFAIVTSFLGVSLSLVDFLADGLQVKKDAKGKLWLCFLTLVPPFIFAVIYPHVFLTALNVAGGFGAVIIFGILPALMAWRGRYYQQRNEEQLVPGGKPVLVLIILFSSLVVAIQLAQQLGYI